MFVIIFGKQTKSYNQRWSICLSDSINELAVVKELVGNRTDGRVASVLCAKYNWLVSLKAPKHELNI